MNLISRVKRPLALVALVLALVLSGAFHPSSRVASTAPSTNNQMLCFDGPVTDDCPTGRYCCDKTGCTCGGGMAP
jgi:hypothetical protein